MKRNGFKTVFLFVIGLYTVLSIFNGCENLPNDFTSGMNRADRARIETLNRTDTGKGSKKRKRQRERAYRKRWKGQ